MAALTVIIPARNEAETLGRTLHRLQEVVPLTVPAAVEILVVDDYSTDGTAAVAWQAGVRVVRNSGDPGYGSAITTGIKAVTTPRLTIMTADGSDDPSVLPAYALASGLVFGDRWSLYHPTGYPTGKQLLNRLGNIWIAYRRQSLYADWTDPFKAYPTKLAQGCLPLANSMSAGLELALRATRQQMYFDVLPVRWKGRSAGESKFRWREPLAYWQTARRWA